MNMHTLANATYDELLGILGLTYQLQLIESEGRRNPMIYAHKGRPVQAWHRSINSRNTVFIMFLTDRYLVSFAKPQGTGQIDIEYCDPEAIEKLIAGIQRLLG